MNASLVIFLVIISYVILYVIISLFTMSLNDFLEKMIKKTLWLWLPFHALKRLTREFRDKYLK